MVTVWPGLSARGAVVLPAAPGFYNRPETVRDLVDFVVQRICDHLGVEVEGYQPAEAPAHGVREARLHLEEIARSGQTFHGDNPIQPGQSRGNHAQKQPHATA